MSLLIVVTLRHVVQTLTAITENVPASLIIMEIHILAVDQNVLSVLIVIKVKFA